MAKTFTQPKIKEPVRLRSKKLSNGSESLYLDIYRDGKRSYEFLKLYTHPETDPQIKALNAETLRAANAIKMERILEITRNEAGLKHTSNRAKMLLSEWLQAYYKAQERKGLRNLGPLRYTIKLVGNYNGKVTMRDVNRDFCLGFMQYLQYDYRTSQNKPLTPKSAVVYVTCLSTALNSAVRADIINENPFMLLTPQERIQTPESVREYLTIDEVKQMIATDCNREDVKRAYLFACFCGLRHSDVALLKWKDISCDNGQWRVTVVMKNTTKPIYLPLSDSAMSWLPERGEASSEDVVFATIPSLQRTNAHIKSWAKKAGIAKHLSFHTSRHTFATMMLTLGVDLYTVSKLLGHSNVKTTQIYTKIVDSKKVEAVHLLDNAF